MFVAKAHLLSNSEHRAPSLVPRYHLARLLFAPTHRQHYAPSRVTLPKRLPNLARTSESAHPIGPPLASLWHTYFAQGFVQTNKTFVSSDCSLIDIEYTLLGPFGHGPLAHPFGTPRNHGPDHGPDRPAGRALWRPWQTWENTTFSSSFSTTFRALFLDFFELFFDLPRHLPRHAQPRHTLAQSLGTPRHPSGGPFPGGPIPLRTPLPGGCTPPDRPKVALPGGAPPILP